MKKVVFRLNLETGKITVDAQGFIGNECDKVLRDVEIEIEEKQVQRKNQAVEQKEEATIEIIY